MVASITKHEQTATLLQDIVARATTAIVDLGYRRVGKKLAPVEDIHLGKFKSLAPRQRMWLRRHQPIEPSIGHARADHWVEQCWLKSAEGDALHAVPCAADFNIRWLLRAIARLGLARFFFALMPGARLGGVIGPNGRNTRAPS